MPAEPRTSIGAKLTQKQKDLMAAAFGTTNRGAESVMNAYCEIQEAINRTGLEITPEMLIYAWQAFPHVYRGTLARELKGLFTREELALLLDITNGLRLTPVIAGQHLLADVENAIALRGLKQKGEIDESALIKKLKGLTLGQAACLEIWANSYWNIGKKGRGDIDWIAQLL